MAWKLQFDPAAEKELGKLDKAVQRTVKKFLAEVYVVMSANMARELIENE